MLILPTLALGAQLEAAQIDLRLLPSGVQVEARYEFATPRDAAEVVVIRLPGQMLDGIAIDRAGPPVVQTEPGLTRITVHGLAGSRSITIRYRAVGLVTRVPIPVPDPGPGRPRSAPTVPGRPRSAPTRVRISVQGLPESARLDQAFPRLAPGPDHAAGAVLANLPSLIRLPPSGPDWSMTGRVELIVLLLLIGAAAAGAHHFRRRTAR